MSPPRNILFVMCDQLRWDYLGCYGHPHLATPHIDALARRGVRFTRAYAQSPVCGPSRMSFYTGRYVGSHGASWNGVPLKVGEWTLGDHLRPLGVRTLLVGKTHMRADVEGMARLGIDPASEIGVGLAECGFEPFERDDGLHPVGPDGAYDPRPTAYDAYLTSRGYGGDNPWQDWANSALGDDGEILSGWLMRHAARPARVAEADSETPYMTRRAMACIAEAGPGPWCLHLSWIKPHWPYIVPAPYHALYGPEQVVPAVRTEAERADPHPVHAAFMQHRASLAFARDEVRRTVIPAYMGLIKQIDDQIGVLMAFLEARGLAGRTMIVLTSDHGDYLGDHWLGEKDLFHDCAVRIPLIVVDPRPEADRARGTVADHLVESIDLAPTFLEFFGGEPRPHILEGRSLLPLLEGHPPAGWRDAVFAEYDYSFLPARRALGVAVRDAYLAMVATRRWKYVHAPGFRPMLFDLERDPGELGDRGGDPALEPVRAEMRAHLLRWALRRAQRTTMSDAEVERAAVDPACVGILIGYWDERELAPGQGAMTATLTAAAALLARLRRLGVEHVFANSGTDFPPLIEALAAGAATSRLELPQAHVMPHESCAMAMAHGYWLASGRCQAVMAHTNVGLANCAIGAINAATERVPLLLFSGRTPVTEKGRFGARTVPIGWGQEMRDQAALVREAMKWDYELRFPEQVVELVDRAWAIASSTPKGPVYMSLPREVLCESCPATLLEAPPAMVPAIAAPHPEALREAATILAAAERPLIIAQRGAGSPAAFSALGALAEVWGIPVVQYWATRLAIALDHPMAAGVDPEPWIGEADAILVIDSLAPWSPEIHRPRPGCRVIQLGPDPLEARFPVRHFRSDVSLTGETADAVLALAAALRPLGPGEAAERRRRAVAARAAAIRAGTRAAAAVGGGAPMTKAWVSHCLAQAIAGRSATVLSELGCPLAPLALREHGSWYQEPHSGGLGWAFPAGLGIQLAEPGRLVVATMGDGSYIFANPVACHQIAEALSLPVLVLVLDNGEWGAVRQSVVGLYPKGAAAAASRMPLTSLRPGPDFAAIAAASRAWAARVEHGGDLPAALAAALDHIDRQRVPALLHLAVAP